MKYQNIYDSEIGEGTRIGSYVEIAHSTIGKDCNIQAFVSIPNGTTIGDNVFIGPKSTICNDKHPPSSKLSPVTIEDRASIGGGVTILPGVTIGTGAKIGGGSVVTKNVPAGETWIGNPARFYCKNGFDKCIDCGGC